MNGIGLKKGTVKLSAHNRRWKNLFEKEKKMLFAEFRNKILEISHGGSTAIPGIPAKPIIDMFAVVSSLSVANHIKNKLEGIGYHYRGKEGVSGRILFVKGPEERRTHHLHLVECDNDEWKNHLLIKNYYLKHPDVARRYAKLKVKLAKKYPDNRSAYGKGKDDFIQSVIAKAKKERDNLLLAKKPLC